ncbi:MAG: metallophosphoesterase [Chloroflexota bacterium]
MKVLSLSDRVDPFIYHAEARERFSEINLVIGCGDLPYYYLEFVQSILNVQVYFVRGNHATMIEYGEDSNRIGPRGAIDLHRKVKNHQGLLLAGVEGSHRYRKGPYQYSQGEMWSHVFSLLPGLWCNRLLHGRYLDVFVTHAPPWGIHDHTDLAHRGIKAFRWLLQTFKPAYHFHGHIFIYRPDAPRETLFEQTRVINTFGYRQTTITIEP